MLGKCQPTISIDITYIGENLEYSLPNLTSGRYKQLHKGINIGDHHRPYILIPLINQPPDEIHANFNFLSVIIIKPLLNLPDNLIAVPAHPHQSGHNIHDIPRTLLIEGIVVHTDQGLE
jgi:hypothetical protein